jgi:hypothetical protein
MTNAFEIGVAVVVMLGLAALNGETPIKRSKALAWPVVALGMAWFWGEIFKLCVGR